MAQEGQSNYFLLGNDVLEDYKNKISSEVLPPELLPIGYDPCGNHICIAFAGEHVGSVYFWDATDYDNLWLIADSFDDFMNLLYIDDTFYRGES